jgi:hypothetical protein
MDKILRTYRHKREWERITKAKELFQKEDIKAYLSNKPHPYEYQAKKGLTAFDYVQWMFANAGNKGMIEASKVVENAQLDINKSI